MFFQSIHSYFSFGRLLKFIFGLAVGVQLIVITYNHFSGFYVLDGYQHFLLRLFRGTWMSLVAGFLIAYPDLYVIRSLNRTNPWGKRLIFRVVVQFALSILIAVVVASLFTLFASLISPYREGLIKIMITNALIFSVVNILVMAILEAWIFLIESRKARQVAEDLGKELSQIRFEVLKSQINPHFMFNSLNVLSGLINTDVSKAQLFIDEFSQVYRYVLDTIEQPVAHLGKELEFARSYLFLQQIRYGKDLTYTVSISSESLERLLPPLSLQVVLENAIKHNIVNEAKPLKIELYQEGEYLLVRNPIQPKISRANSTGLGLKNLARRYALISAVEPVFEVRNEYYVARLPLLKSESNESTDH